MRVWVLGLISLFIFSCGAESETAGKNKQDNVSKVKVKKPSGQKEDNMDNAKKGQKPERVNITTSMGSFVVELNAAKAPETVKNFLRYVNEGFYDGTIFHRVKKGFMIQGGGFSADMTKKKTHKPVSNEADNGLKNKRATIAMARRPDPHSATSQFFINTVDNDFLNFKTPSARGWGYCVFGKVVSGMDVVDKIESVPTGSKEGHRDVPLEPVVIERVKVVGR